ASGSGSGSGSGAAGEEAEAFGAACGFLGDSLPSSFLWRVGDFECAFTGVLVFFAGAGVLLREPAPLPEAANRAADDDVGFMCLLWRAFISSTFLLSSALCCCASLNCSCSAFPCSC